VPAARRLSINRFTVMAMLQAARAARLGLPQDSAYSWGLNRAIWYAAAKRGFKSGVPGEEGERAEKAKPGEEYHLGQDLAYRDPASPTTNPIFTLGGEVQSAEEFRAKIASRFASAQDFDRAWEEAMRIISQFDEAVLGSGGSFYSTIYKPRRDDLVTKWVAEFGPGPAPRPKPRKRVGAT
jgi:hypothetical protein